MRASPSWNLHHATKNQRNVDRYLKVVADSRFIWCAYWQNHLAVASSRDCKYRNFEESGSWFHNCSLNALTVCGLIAKKFWNSDSLTNRGKWWPTIIIRVNSAWVTAAIEIMRTTSLRMALPPGEVYSLKNENSNLHGFSYRYLVFSSAWIEHSSSRQSSWPVVILRQWYSCVKQLRISGWRWQPRLFESALTYGFF